MALLKYFTGGKVFVTHGELPAIDNYFTLPLAFSRSEKLNSEVKGQIYPRLPWIQATCQFQQKQIACEIFSLATANDFDPADKRSREPHSRFIVADFVANFLCWPREHPGSCRGFVTLGESWFTPRDR